MDEDKISVIAVDYTSSNKRHEVKSRIKEEIQCDSDVSTWNMCHLFSVLTICVIFLAPVTLIPRTNSIFYQSHWYTFNFCALVFVFLFAINDILNMATYFKEKSLLSIRMVLKLFSLFILVWTIPYLIAYLIWCQYLKYNWPIPLLGYNFILCIITAPTAMWTSFPRNLRKNLYFQQNFKMYALYIVNIAISIILRQGILMLFIVLSGYLELIPACLISLLKQLHYTINSKLVDRMVGGQEEASQVCLGLSIYSAYSFFIAAKLPNIEIYTVIVMIAFDFFLHLKMTYKIIQIHNMIYDETRTGNRTLEKQRMVTKLALAELTEGMVPIVYAVGFSMAYYGFNGTLMHNVKSDDWDSKPVDDIGYLFLMMLVLFGVDMLSMLVNSITLSTLTNVNLIRECSRIMKRFWHFMAVKFAVSMILMFATKDVNIGMDLTGEFSWITNEGRNKLINCSIDLSHEEKLLLLN